MYKSTILSLPLAALFTLVTSECTNIGYTSCDDNIVHWYNQDTGEVCDPLQCGGGRAPLKTDVPGCDAYKGTEIYSSTVSYLSCFTSAGAAPAEATADADEEEDEDEAEDDAPTNVGTDNYEGEMPLETDEASDLSTTTHAPKPTGTDDEVVESVASGVSETISEKVSSVSSVVSSASNDSASSTASETGAAASGASGDDDNDEDVEESVAGSVGQSLAVVAAGAVAVAAALL